MLASLAFPREESLSYMNVSSGNVSRLPHPQAVILLLAQKSPL